MSFNFRQFFIRRRCLSRVVCGGTNFLGDKASGFIAKKPNNDTVWVISCKHHVYPQGKFGPMSITCNVVAANHMLGDAVDVDSID